MAVVALSTNYSQPLNYFTSYDSQYAHEESVYTSKHGDEDLSSLLRATITNGAYEFSYVGESHEEFDLDPAIQEMILENESDIHSLVTLDIKQENESDNDSVMLELDSLDFLDNVFSDTDDSCSSLSASPKTTSRNDSIDSGYGGEVNVPNFDYLDSSSDHSLKIDTNYLDEDEDDLDSKPYCKSNRGAKKNLLWKFILQTLEIKHQNLVSWVDERNGIFKFDDTVTFSKQWGEKKQKADMNFEKLSRGIRHYYKSGLMARIPSERLVYKFNWHRVPRRYRKY